MGVSGSKLSLHVYANHLGLDILPNAPQPLIRYCGTYLAFSTCSSKRGEGSSKDKSDIFFTIQYKRFDFMGGEGD